jgi:TonB-dependent starch-binding outer membrane protein SusC
LIPTFAGFDANGNVTLVAADGGAPTTDYTKALLTEKGSALPKTTLSWINNFQFGHVDVSFQLRGVFGNKIMNNLRSNLAIPGSILETNMLAEVADYPVNYSTNQLSDLWIEDASFVRMDNWQIGYNLPLKSETLTNARIYVAGNNLFIITKYKGIDPELDVKGDLQDNGRSQRPNDMGMDNSNIYPKTRSFQLGVNLTF